jgi:hypothetical protein
VAAVHDGLAGAGKARPWSVGCAAESADAVLGHPRVAVPSRITPLVVLGRLRARRGDPDVWNVLDEALELATATRRASAARAGSRRAGRGAVARGQRRSRRRGDAGGTGPGTRARGCVGGRRAPCVAATGGRR